MSITLKAALAGIEKTIHLATTTRSGAPVSLAVVNANGTTIASVKMDGAPDRVAKIALQKAYTAAKMTLSTEAFCARLADESLQIEWFCDSGYTALAGGIPIFEDGLCVGAVGISGRSLADDSVLAMELASFVQTL